jgi:sugar phosphate permease
MNKDHWSQEGIEQILDKFYRSRSQLFILLFFSYVGFYFCRVNLLAALPLLEDSFGFTKTQTGLILSSYFVVYSIGKLINGLLGDRIGGKVMMLIGIGGSVGCNVLFGFGRTLQFFTIVWSINAFFQTMGWLSLISLMSHWYTSKESGRAIGIISLSYLLGDFAARASAGIIIGRSNSHWPDLFWIHAAIFLGIGVLVWLFVRPFPEKMGFPDIDTYALHKETKDQIMPKKRKEPKPEEMSLSSKSWLVIMLTNKWFWLVCLIYLGLSITRYVFWNWSIVYLKESGLRTNLAIITSTVFPILGSLGAIFAGWVSDKMNAKRGPVLSIMASCMVLSIFLFSRVPYHQSTLQVLILAVVGFTLIGPYSLVAGAMAIDFGSKHSSAAAAGIIDAVGAIGAVFSGAGMGYMIDKLEWSGAFSIVIGISFITALLCFIMWNHRPLREIDTGLK